MIRPLLWLPLIVVGVAPAVAQEASPEKRAQKLHAISFGEQCHSSGGYMPDDPVESWTFRYAPSWSEGTEEDKEDVTLVRIFCSSGAYNESHAYYLLREYEGMTSVGFAEPAFDVTYENDNFDGAVEEITTVGMSSTGLLVNSLFDPETLSIDSFSKWRGLGDASSSGQWVFRDGAFALVHFAVDASYDGEMNPEVMVDYLGD
jgi:hypothetical protein